MNAKGTFLNMVLILIRNLERVLLIICNASMNTATVNAFKCGLMQLAKFNLHLKFEWFFVKVSSLLVSAVKVQRTLKYLHKYEFINKG